MSINARDEDYELVELGGRPALFTNSRIDRTTVPCGFYCYDLRGSDNDPGSPETLEHIVAINHAGTILTPEQVKLPKDGFRRVKGKLNFIGESKTLSEFCEEHCLKLEPDCRKFPLRPATAEEAALFYSLDEKDADLGTVGHLRIDFGHEGDEFWSTWWPHNDDELNTPEFKAELQKLVDELRKSGPLNGLSAMSSYCCEHGNGRLSDGSRVSYGYVAESERYRYCLRCTPIRGDYNAYLYIYDKRQQEISRLQTAMRSKQDLPEICFSTLPSDGSLICIRHGETGHFKSDWDTGDPVKNREIADYNNKKLGVSKVKEEAMVAKSMTGWAPHDPGFGQTMG